MSMLNERPDNACGNCPVMGGISFSAYNVQIIPSEIRFSDVAFLHQKKSSKESTVEPKMRD
jgi:hypothetical protein